MSFLLSLISFMNVTVQTEEIPRAVWRKDEVFFSVHIRNGFLLPLTPVRVYVKVCAKDKRDPESKVIVLNLPPMKSVTLKISNVMSFRGEYKIGLEKVEIFDVLKLYSLKKKWRHDRFPVSCPREIPINRLRDDNEDETENSAAKPDGFNRNTFSHLREYRDGDTLRHIHWKLSARLDDLIVKQMEQNYNNSALVFCDFTGTYPSAEAALSASDPCIEAALAIIRRILLGGNSALFMWQDARTELCEKKEIADSESCAELARSLTLLPHEPFEGSFVGLIDEYEDEVWRERAVYIITDRLTDELIEKIRSLGLTLKNNTVLAVITPQIGTSPENGDLIEYLESNTKIKVCRVDNDDITVLGERIRS
jgi:hypothetical protein